MLKPILLTLASAALVVTQMTAQAPKATVTGTGSFTAFVENMDRSLAFYHDAFGMDVPALPASGERPYNAANPGLFAFFDIPGAKERHQSARTGRVTVEMMEIQQVPHQTIALRLQDPGNATLVFIVKDVDASLAKAMQAKAIVATPGNKPVAFPDGFRAILVKDSDGRFVELRQLATPPAGTPPAADSGKAQSNDILDLRLAITVNNMDATLKAYRDVMGFKVEGETPFSADAATRNLTGLAKAEVRRARVQAPASQLWIEFTEYKGVDRKPLSMKIQDRGAARLQIRVADTDAFTAAVKAAGMRNMSTDGAVQPIPPNFKAALIADPNNFFLTPFAPCDGCAPGIGVPAKGK